MLEVGIPVFHSRKTLPRALDSLVAQTKQNFIVCVSIDGDGEDYNDIIDEYWRRGLKIRIITSNVNCGPGMARQKVIDTTKCDYITFLDSDDMFMPRAVEVLYTEAKLRNYDILKSNFIRENANETDVLMTCADNIITWFHGKIYKVQFLKDKNIRFKEGLRIDEDAYFNAVAQNSTTNIGAADEVLYVWRANKESLTRSSKFKDYFIENHMNYIYSQVEALKDLHKINDTVSSTLITSTLLNIYYYYMSARFYKCDENEMDDCIGTLRNEEWMQKWLMDGNNWIAIITNIKAGQVYENEYVVFYDETFNKWAARLLKGV